MNIVTLTIKEHEGLLIDYIEGAQNRFRNNDYRSFEEWINDKEE